MKTSEPNADLEENKKDGACRFLDNLFAPKAEARESNYENKTSNRKRDLSEGFLGKVNENNLVDKVKRGGRFLETNNKDAVNKTVDSRGNSVSSNIAMF